MPRYLIRGHFDTDRPLTEQEYENLILALHVQVAEPVDSAGDDETYTTSDPQVWVLPFDPEWYCPGHTIADDDEWYPGLGGQFRYCDGCTPRSP